MNLNATFIRILEILRLKKPIEPEIKQLDFLDEGNGYVPKKLRVMPDGKIATFTIYPGTDMYASCSWTKNIGGICKGLSKTDKLLQIWKSIVDRETKIYSYDYGDDWRFPAETVNLHSGDCDDSTILFITACKDAGISETEVFNACGNSAFGYHSYPIAWLNERDLLEIGIDGKAGWYIFESTLDFFPGKPMALIGSAYKVDTLQNWTHVGTIDGNKRTEFNG